MLNKNFITRGFEFIEYDTYINEENSASLHDLKKIFYFDL